MQKNFGTIFLQLFLCLLLSVVLLAYSYSVINDFRSSLQPDYSTVLNSGIYIFKECEFSIFLVQ
ncbi:hypothetical protein RchiOBHm_Chr1g0331401 [Rosa chinensis]|uniref:Uncharacterized protein n=1 Tax=Rosa chinensis TaxID=74649 RepID=A0A2P6SBI3_ROSCH|nr:hypothetical protein RchiOBHm_Chr1g0331401 [Rosa chinensis]